jgi:hypothetical protein
MRAGTREPRAVSGSSFFNIESFFCYSCPTLLPFIFF